MATARALDPRRFASRARRRRHDQLVPPHRMAGTWARAPGRRGGGSDPARARARADEFGIPSVYADADSMLGKEERRRARRRVASRDPRRLGGSGRRRGGVDVLCQKPLTPTLAEAEALVAGWALASRLMIHENWRFRPWYRELHRWIAGGMLGEIDLARLAIDLLGLPARRGGAGDRRSCASRSWHTGAPPDDRGGADPPPRHDAVPLRRPCASWAPARAARLADVTGETFCRDLPRDGRGRARDGHRHDGARPATRPARPTGWSWSGGERARGAGGQRAAAPRARPRGPSATTRTRGYQASFDGVIAHFVDLPRDRRAASRRGPPTTWRRYGSSSTPTGRRGSTPLPAVGS